MEDFDLLDDLGVETEAAPAQERTPKEQRIIAGFEEIERFYEEHKRLPAHGADRDIFERIYAVRLDQIRHSSQCREALSGPDSHDLLGSASKAVDIDDDALLADLGVDTGNEGLTELKHVRSASEKQAVEEVAQRVSCKNFHKYEELFIALQANLKNGALKTLKYQNNGLIDKGDWFIVEGQKAFVAEKGPQFINDYDRPDHRLRVIYDNGTESDLLLRSLQRALNRDKLSRRVTSVDLGPLFGSELEVDDVSSGYIYVLRSLSEQPFIAENRQTIHKIGVTGGAVSKRIAGAKKDPTYLLADVEVVASYELSGINRKKLETLLHKFFAEARLDVTLKDRFDQAVEPQEWFLVPLDIIKNAVARLIEGTLTEFRYDVEHANMVKI